jgi:hypothetical protein
MYTIVSENLVDNIAPVMKKDSRKYRLKLVDAQELVQEFRSHRRSKKRYANFEETN